MYVRAILLLLVAFTIGQTALAQDAIQGQKLRFIIETDAGGDPDDEQSLVRFLLYTCDWDVEGIICTRPQTKRDENFNSEATGLDIVRRQLKAYEQVYDKLKQHGDFPPPQQLFERTVPGYDSDAGVQLIIDAVDREDPRPVWFSNWGTNDGTESSLKRALDKVLAERGHDEYVAFKDKIRLCSDDMFGDHTLNIDPPFRKWVYTKFPNMDGGRWYHRFGPLTATAGGFDLERDVLTGHGPLGETYPTNTHLPQKEGDTPEFLYLIPNGLNEPEEPTWGSWAGRFGKQENVGERDYYWPNVRDVLDGKAHRDHTLLPWVEHIQNDFKARMDWCVMDYDDANHPPEPRLSHDRFRSVVAGESISFDASSSVDPDGDALDYRWYYYPEAGTYDGPHVAVNDEHSAQPSFTAPDVEQPQTIHLILILTDRGSPPLTRYARNVITVQPRKE